MLLTMSLVAFLYASLLYFFIKLAGKLCLKKIFY
jgi:hypothetical protein